MTIQRVLHLNQNVSLHHRLSSSPFLFMFFFFFFFFLFFWDSCKGFCLFDQKKKEEKSFFLRFSSLSFLVLSGAFERDKKKRALFFLLLSDANKRTNANASLRLKSTTGGRVQKDDARLKKVLFLFCCVVLCSCFLIRMLFRFERRERKGNHQKSPKKERKNSLGPKNSGSSCSSSFFCSKNEPPKNEGGYKINSGSCRKLLSLNYNWGQFKFQLAS